MSFLAPLSCGAFLNRLFSELRRHLESLLIVHDFIFNNMFFLKNLLIHLYNLVINYNLF